MKYMKKILIFLLVLALGWGAAHVLFDRPEADPPATEPSQTQPREDASATAPAPDFTVYDRDGNPVRLSDFEGKPTVVNFWASWCGPCKAEMPDFQDKYLELGDEVNFLIINMTDGVQETVQTASDFVDGKGYTFPVYFDSDLEAARAYGVYSIPMTYFIDAQGNAVAHATGAISADLLQKGIDMIR